ncbi:unnamed protein product [Acanthoscelides obtectus]|uniref:Uncharacterized protein n=1 Tax=Acanthoscelides obtectus TaxID=200917 RepID=A0A9P0P100_ACAOB|nr:unnamed protein product [Acanthoscelides obtectus]CAK1639443.1 hypothetical protein AOBTE_LOCUS11182 [Acanthoscelides obtectus]
MANKDKAVLLDICLLLQCTLAVKAPIQDSCFLKATEAYERIDKTISKAVLQKFCQHFLWYLAGEVSVLSLLDDDVDEETEVKIVANLA